MLICILFLLSPRKLYLLPPCPSIHSLLHRIYTSIRGKLCLHTLFSVLYFLLKILFYCEQCIYYFSFLHRSVSDVLEVSSGVLFLEFGCSFVLITPISQGWPCHPFFLFGVAWSILVGRSVRDKWVYRCPGWGRRRSLRVTRSSPVWGSSSTSGLARPVFQSTRPVPVYFDQCSTVPVYFILGPSPFLLQGLILIGISPLQGLIFIGISLRSARTRLHPLLIHLAVSSLNFIVFLCVYVFQFYFLFKCFFEMLFLCFELHFQYNRKLLSIFKEMLVIII